MKQITQKSWLRTVLVTCLNNATAQTLVKVSEQFSSSLEYYLAGRFTIKDLN